MERSGPRWVGGLWGAVAVLGIAGASFVNTAAASTAMVSPLALPMSSVSDGDQATFEMAGASGGSSAGFAQAPPPYEAVRWRPRRDRGRWREPREPVYRERYREPRAEGFTQVHAGFLDPEVASDAGLLLGFRMGFAVDRNLQIGGMLDWRHHGSSETAIVSETPGPGGTVIVTRNDLARSSSDLIPIMGFVQAEAGEMGVIPYVGAGAGYEILHLSAEDFQTGQEFRGTFGGFGWQVWAGAALPLSSNARLLGEVFLNKAELSRDTDDPTTGQQIRETIDMDGAGARFGLRWGF